MTTPTTDRPASDAGGASAPAVADAPARPARRSDGRGAAIRAVGRATFSAAFAVAASLPFQWSDGGAAPGDAPPVGIGGAVAGLQVLFAGACLFGELAATRRARLIRLAVAGLFTPGLCLTGFVFFSVVTSSGLGGIADGTAFSFALRLLADFPAAIGLTAVTFGAGFPLAHASWPDGSEPEAWTLPRKLVWVGNAGVSAGLALFACCVVGGVPVGGLLFIVTASGGAIGFAVGDAAAAQVGGVSTRVPEEASDTRVPEEASDTRVPEEASDVANP